MSDLVAVCPRCRLLARPGTCPVDGTETLVLADPAQRGRMVEHAWGTAMQQAELAKARGSRLSPQHAAVGGVTGALSASLAFVGTGSGSLSLITGAVAGLLGAAFARPRSLTLFPNEAAAMPAYPRVGTGKIVDGEEMEAPSSGTPCIAWAVELRQAGSWGMRTVFRAGATRGMEIVMDGGDRVRIPAGPVWLEGAFEQLDGDPRPIEALLAEIDPDGEANLWKLFPFNIIMEQLLFEGDRVDVLGVVEPRPVQGDAKLYREAPVVELVHPGLAVLRRA